MAVHVCDPSHLGSRNRKIMGPRPVQAKLKRTLSQKQNKNKRARDVVSGIVPA
jgi:hypothetical protein